jgi:transcriptional regulator with XRE-family HTH domain
MANQKRKSKDVTAARKRKARLVEAGIKQRDIARKLNVSEVAVSNVISGKIRSRRIEEAVAEEVGVSHSFLFRGVYPI